MSGVIEDVAKSWLTDQPWQKVKSTIIYNSFERNINNISSLTTTLHKNLFSYLFLGF